MIYGIGVNIKTGEIFPATFPDKGPDQALRCARHLTGQPQVYTLSSTFIFISYYEKIKKSLPISNIQL